MQILNLIIQHQQLEKFKNFQYNISMKDIIQLKEIAKEIFQLQQANKVKKDKSIQDKIEYIMMSLTLEEMLIIDSIIQRKLF